MARFRMVFLSFSVIGVLLFAGFLRAGLDGNEREDLFRSLGILAEVVHLVENEYVDELNDEALALSLDAGLVESVDRWAAVVPTERVEDYREFLQSPPPFGLLVGGRMGSAAVRYAVPGSPAEGVGLKSWEVIERVNGIYTRGRPLWLIRLELQDYEKNEQKITLTIMDRNVDERREVVVEPSRWAPDAFGVSDLDGVRVLTITNLTSGTAAAVETALKGAEAIVLDLRELVWGEEAQAVAVADLFLEEGEIARWEGRRAGEESFMATESSVTDIDPVVLIGFNTEGVGEILAAALERGGSPLVGWPTAGHAPHMRFIHHGDLHLLIPVGQWLHKDGEPINENGLKPAFEVELVEADSTDDPALERALEVASGKAESSEPVLDEAA
ncbi:MAG: hypothetical protein K8R59_02700 [Thermoanaerobaculales bacterium]|nr:hypothetical protein [Thermoanaerobaculales bacterium]